MIAGTSRKDKSIILLEQPELRNRELKKRFMEKGDSDTMRG
jgi:hypothetical protein